MEAEIDAAQVLFSGQKMEKRELRSQINFSPAWPEEFN